MSIISATKSKRSHVTVPKHSRFALWVEEYLFHPTLFQRFISIVLLPFSLLYCLIVIIKRFLGTRAKRSFGLPIISIGNLCAVFMSALLNKLGQIKPSMTGNGRLMVSEENVSTKSSDVKPTAADYATGLALGVVCFNVANLYAKLKWCQDNHTSWFMVGDTRIDCCNGLEFGYKNLSPL